MIGQLVKLEDTQLRLDTVEVVPSLPAASWLATVAEGRVAVVCGERLESGPDGVVEGCWDDDFGAFDFDRSDHVFGSGLRLRGGGVTFVAPSHTLESLYVFESPERLVVSNSLAFLLEHEGVEVPDSQPICRSLATVGLGTERYETILFPYRDGRVSHFVDATLRLAAGQVEFVPRAFHSTFDDFESYRGYLRATVARVVANGRSERRRFPFELLASVSSGYDSAASAAVAAECSTTEAVTLSRSRGGRSDSGEGVASALGMRVRTFDRDAACVGRPAICLAEFMASGFGGEDLPFANFEPALPGRLLITGFVGGAVWNLSAGPNEHLVRQDLSGNSLGEYRLRVGFAHLPLPYIGARRQADLGRISRAHEMAAFKLGTSYDRPIPRRIVEEAGVARERFGQSDKAVSVLGFTDLRTLPEPARSDLHDYVRSHATIGMRAGQLWWQVRSFAWRALRKGLSTVGLWRRPVLLERLVLGTEWLVFEHEAPITSELAFRWALDVVRPRYALASDRSRSRRA